LIFLGSMAVVDLVLEMAEDILLEVADGIHL
jgi:hypothetical protein